MSELKLCPLCGKDGMIEQTCPHYGHNVPKKYFPKCSNENCALFNPSVDGEFGDVYRDYDTREEAEAAWNTRPLEDALKARIEVLEAKLEVRDWECLSCGWTYRGKDQCPKCGDTAHPLTTAREIAQESRIAALEAALVEIRDRSFRCLLPAEEIETEREFFAYAEINEIGMKADRALKGEVKE